MCPIGEAGPSEHKIGRQKAKCQKAWELDQVALGAGSLGGHKSAPLPGPPHIDEMSLGVVEAAQRGAMVVEAEWQKTEDKGCSRKATVDAERAKRRLTMVGKPGFFEFLDCVKCHGEMGVCAQKSTQVLHWGTDDNWLTTKLCHNHPTNAVAQTDTKDVCEKPLLHKNGRRQTFWFFSGTAHDCSKAFFWLPATHSLLVVKFNKAQNLCWCLFFLVCLVDT